MLPTATELHPVGLSLSVNTLYGAAHYGGTNGNGTLFAVNTDGTGFTNLHVFAAGTGSYPDVTNSDGAQPDGLVVSNSTLYGTTVVGGSGGAGVVFKLNTDGTGFTNLYTCSALSGNSGVLTYGTNSAGAGPASLVLSGDTLYGAALYGGTNGNGTVFALTLPGGGGGGGTNCTYSINPTNAVFDAAGGSDTATVTANGTSCIWTAISNNAFILINSGSIVSGDGTVSYSVAANTNASEQIGTITIEGQTFTVTEAAAPCSVSPTSTTASFGSAGGSSNVVVTANGTSCIWTAISNNAFILIDSGSIGSGNGTVSYSVAANTNASERTGTITIAGQTYTVFEGGASCTYTLSATSTNAAAGGGSGSVSVTASNGCAWTAISNSGFIAITSGTNGTGDGVVNYTVAANSNTVSQTGSLTIAGQTYTITQVAAPVTEMILYSFVGSPGDGDGPAGLVQGSDGNFYGTSGGGTYNAGTVFRISPSGSYTSLYSFAGYPSDGSGPFGLVQGSDSNFYGTTAGGGTSANYCNGECGTVFRISPSGTYTSLYSFGSSATDGENPEAGLVQGSDGNFYGTTSQGGTNSCSCGTVFRISPNGTYTSLYSFHTRHTRCGI